MKQHNFESKIPLSALFLLYVCVMFIIIFLQQEFVLLPELQNLDIVGEDARVRILERYQNTRWVSFLLAPLSLLIRLSLITLCLFVGSFFYAEMNGKKFKDWWGVALVSQAVMLTYSIVLCLVNLIFGANKTAELTTYTSLLFLGGGDIEPWLRMPLAAVNAF
jgi:hypothetical protein